MPKIQIKIKLDKKTANQLVEAIAKEGHDPQAFVARLIGAAAHEVARLADGWAQKQSAELKIEAEKDEKPAKKAKPKKAAQKSDVKTEEDLLAFLRRVFKAIYASNAIKGFCYTQFADVEQEINGLVTADRKPKADKEVIAKIVRGEDYSGSEMS